MKIGLLQINPTVGDLDGNAARIAEGARNAAAQGAKLVVTTELALLGYPPRDLLLNGAFVQRAWATLENLARELRDAAPVLVGVAEPNPHATGRCLFNAAALLRGGKIQQCIRKSLLPTYDVFDEDRYFEPAKSAQVVQLDGHSLGITICEDVWNDRDFFPRQRYHHDPLERLAQHGAGCLINLSASPFTVGKQQLREAMLSSLARKYRAAVCYVNQVGGNDDLVFDGRSCAFAPDGRLFARAKAFAEDLLIVDLNSFHGAVAQDDFAPESEIWRALTLGTSDYMRKCGFKSAVLGLSGGVDSALTAAVAAEAVGPENVLGVLMPSPYSSRGSIEDARQLAKNLGIRTLTIPIAPMMESFEEALREAFAGRERDVTEENIQARIRGNLLMSLSNKYGALLLTTGNKSELSVGYCTLYGDMSGGLAVISDVFKTMVYRVSRWLNATRGFAVIPEPTLTKAPSAELRPNQTDQDSLPPYDVLDAILLRHVEQHRSAEEIVAEGFDRATVEKVVRLVRISEFKRKQAAPGIKVTDRAFGTGWRVPIARKDVMTLSQNR
jgi:NAD+ synthase/NAD+ synthase (glutamine-hydrolysing)